MQALFAYPFRTRFSDRVPDWYYSPHIREVVMIELIAGVLTGIIVAMAGIGVFAEVY